MTPQDTDKYDVVGRRAFVFRGIRYTYEDRQYADYKMDRYGSRVFSGFRIYTALYSSRFLPEKKTNPKKLVLSNDELATLHEMWDKLIILQNTVRRLDGKVGDVGMADVIKAYLPSDELRRKMHDIARNHCPDGECYCGGHCTCGG